MKIYLSPQVPLNTTDKIIYEFEEDVIKATMPNSDTDVFDFRGFPDGELKMYDEEGNSLVETHLDPNPLQSAKRVNGELQAELLNYIGTDATEEERFPEWINHTEYEKPSLKKETEPNRSFEQQNPGNFEFSSTNTEKKNILEDWDDF